MIGVLVMAYGGPDRLDDIEPYLLDVRGGRPTSPELIAEMRQRYAQIGGASPILRLTQAQAQALEAALNREDPSYRTYVGMRHWKPYIREALRQMQADGITRAVGLVMAPHYSKMSVEAYYARAAEASLPVELARIDEWHLLPGFLDALARHVHAGLERFPEGQRAQVHVLFTAHSLPERILSWGDPYREQLFETVEGVIDRVGPQPHSFAFQSAGRTPEPWLGPTVGEAVERLVEEGRRQVLVTPVGFVSEHVEVLYDIDIELKRQAEGLQMRLERAELVQADPEMMAGLARLVSQKAAAAGWLDPAG